MSFKPPRGMRDYLPEDLAKRRFIESCIRRLFRLYGYEEVETPAVEGYELLAAKVGEETRRSMYVFEDLKGRRLALRPEGTAPVARLVATRLRTAPKPLRLGYIWDFYRYDEPQFGRYRRFYQGGFELIGVDSVEADVEVLCIAADLFRMLRLPGVWFRVSHVGVLRSLLAFYGYGEDVQNRVLGLADKKMYGEIFKLLDELGSPGSLVDTVSRVVKLRGFDRRRVLGEARKVLEGFTGASEGLGRLSDVLDLLSEVHPDVRVMVDLGFARGLEYYTGIVFEVFVEGFDIALAGGGRYDRLIEVYGGEPTPAVGFSPGVDRILAVMDRLGVSPTCKPGRILLVTPVSEGKLREAFKVACRLRAEGIPATLDVKGRRLRSTLSYADRMGFRYVAIIGEEASEGYVTLRDMDTRTQEKIPVEELPSKLSKFKLPETLNLETPGKQFLEGL